MIEYANMHFVCSFWNRNCRTAAMKHQLRYSGHGIPCQSMYTEFNIV